MKIEAIMMMAVILREIFCNYSVQDSNKHTYEL